MSDEYRFVGDGLRWLSFDCECRPLSWYAGDFVTREITAIAWRFLDQKHTACVLLGRDANRLTKRGIQAVRQRVVGDVNQQIELREKLLELGLLKPPSVWSSLPHGGNRYHA